MIVVFSLTIFIFQEVNRYGAAERVEGSSLLFNNDGYPRDCSEAQITCSGTANRIRKYYILPEGSSKPFQASCDQEIDGGGWTVIQRRLDGSVNFTRNWEDYRDGFGFLNREFWIGNEKLSYLTNQKRYTLRIDIKNSTNHEMFLSYDDFSTSDEWGKYQLTRLGNFTGNTDFNDDFMRIHLGMKFSTFDNNNIDKQDGNCTETLRAGWWYNGCDDTNLNAEYHSINLRNRQMEDQDNNLRFTEMKISPTER
ncbi:fibrinogen-like protein A isoform X2 [Apostichopus japonicus]|uniref:fibrinogen-like protein A isoform X2 n=1 Tax=Stichopus japonicus TaxID=307972 RepID=UPI003AB16A59